MGLCSAALLVLSTIMSNSGVFALGFTFCIISGCIAVGINWAFKEAPIDEPEEYNGQDFMDYPQ